MECWQMGFLIPLRSLQVHQQPNIMRRELRVAELRYIGEKYCVQQLTPAASAALPSVTN